MSGYRVQGPYSQIDGSFLDGSNCGVAVCTDLIDKATCGALRIQAPTIRTATKDRSNGVVDSVLVDTVWRLTKDTDYPVRLRALALDTRLKVEQLADSGKEFGAAIDTAVTRPTRFRTNNYIGWHKVFVPARDGKYYTIDDPGTTAAGYMEWPSDLLYRAMEARGGGKHLVLVAPDTEDVDVECVTKGRLRATPSVKGKDLGALTVGKRYHSTRTVNGGPWQRRDGGRSTGWWKLPGGYAAGERMARAA